jgi:hypothetical protein
VFFFLYSHPFSSSTRTLSTPLSCHQPSQGPERRRSRRQELLSRLVLGLPADSGGRSFVQRAGPPRAGSRPTSAQGRRQGSLHPTSCSLQPATGARRVASLAPLQSSIVACRRARRAAKSNCRQEQDELPPPSVGFITTRAGDLTPSSSSDPAIFQR